MITKEDILELMRALPPRLPRGSPENNARRAPGAKLGAGLRRYKKEHGISYFDDMKGDKE